MGKLSNIGHALYEGRISIDFVGRRWIWYGISGAILALALFGLLGKGLNLGIEFKGGVEYRVVMPAGQANQAAVEKIRDAVAREAGDSDISEAESPVVNTSGSNTIRIQTEPLNNADANTISDTVREAAGVDRDAVSQDEIGATWGKQVADRALLGLGVFLVLVVLFIWAYFREWKMSVGAIVALAHDVVITVGVYALSGFEVTPATVTGILTILGFSLYDTVVVFDKVRENTKNLARTRQTYAEAANLAINQTLVRSINTSIVALLPVGALLYVGVATLGSGALKDLALALFVGMAAGAYSSIFIATPLVVQLKELEPGIKSGDARTIRNRNKKNVDKYASVPAFSEGLPLQDEPRADEHHPAHSDGSGGADESDEESVHAAAPARAPRFTAGERTPSRPVSPSAAAKRAQPTRKPRSQRGKG
jgi:preprotein translocase subunit SecF